jgi:methylglutaconyl-CoA hydratase
MEEELDRLIARYANEVQTAGPHAVAAAKKLIAEISRRDRTGATEYSIDAIAGQRVSPEGQEGMRAFLDKRKPTWTP